MKKGDKVKVVYDNTIGQVTKVIRKNGKPFKVYVRHWNHKRTFMYFAHNLELYEK